MRRAPERACTFGNRATSTPFLTRASARSTSSTGGSATDPRSCRTATRRCPVSCPCAPRGARHGWSAPGSDRQLMSSGSRPGTSARIDDTASSVSRSSADGVQGPADRPGYPARILHESAAASDRNRREERGRPRATSAPPPARLPGRGSSAATLSVMPMTASYLSVRTGIFFGCASGDLGISTRRTPSRRVAVMPSVSRSSVSVKARW